MEKRTGRITQRRRKSRAVELGPREKRRLGQLMVCLVLFGAVLLSRGNTAWAELRRELSFTLRASADWRTSFADFERSVTAGGDLPTALTGLWEDIFPVQNREAPQLLTGGPLYRSTLRHLTGGTGSPLLPQPSQEEPQGEQDPMALSATQATGELQEIEPQEPAGAAEPAVIYVDYSGPALPDNATMDRYALGLSETVSPVMAPLSSEFGWREHPIDGDEKFHYGLDLAADTGTPVLAFAAGTVEYIGESDVYGQYLQIDHGNGLASFYAHCSALLAQPGQVVEAGETVALSGGSGRVTGPHLHFELKKDGVRLNPLYYVETLP